MDEEADDAETGDVVHREGEPDDQESGDQDFVYREGGGAGGESEADGQEAGDPEAGDQQAAGDPEAGDPEAGDPEAGDPEAGDPEASDPEAGIDKNQAATMIQVCRCKLLCLDIVWSTCLCSGCFVSQRKG